MGVNYFYGVSVLGLEVFYDVGEEVGEVFVDVFFGGEREVWMEMVC